MSSQVKLPSNVVTWRARVLIIAIAGVLAALAMNAQDAQADVLARSTVELKPNLTVSGAMITLGDLFDNAGAAAGTTVIASPRPGQHIDIDASSLASLASDNGLDWANLTGLRTVEVTRASRPIGAQMIDDLLAKALSVQDDGKNLDVRLLQSGLSLNAAIDDPSDPTVRILSFDQESGRFQAEVDAPGGDSATVNGMADEVMSVPVLSHPFQRGEVIQQSDLGWMPMRIDTISRQVISDPAAIVGLSARRPLRSGQPLLVGDIERPSVVIKGALVTMSYKMPGMILTDQGRALESGAVGDTINVLNERSHRTIQATVVAENAVELISTTPVAIGPQASN